MAQSWLLPTQQVRAHFLRTAYDEAVVAADKALALAVELNLPQPAAALGFSGGARANRGEPEGQDEMREALSLAIEQGEGRTAAILYNNLGFSAWLYDGPQANLDLNREGIEFARRRGLDEVAELMAGGQLSLLAELGRIEEALTEAAPAADRAEAAGDIGFVDPRSLQLRLLTARGEHRHAPSPEPMLKTAWESREPQQIAMVVAAAADLLQAQGHPQQARVILRELDQLLAVRIDSLYPSRLAGLVRTALALGEQHLATSLTEGVPNRTPLQQHALTSCRAQLAEAAGSHAGAATLYADAAQRWHEFGNVPERAYALLGQGRCLRALGDPSAEKPLTEARELFASMGYKPALAETEPLLRQAQAAAN